MSEEKVPTNEKPTEAEKVEISRVKIKFTIENNGEVEGELVRFLAPRTIDMIVRKLPIEGRAAQWKEEVYFETPIKMGEEKAKPTVETGRSRSGRWEVQFAYSTGIRSLTVQ